jgi:predicted PurR-regulated permease PerM
MSVDADTPAKVAPAHLPGGSLSAAKILVWGAIGLLLYEAHVAFIPIALALLFALILSSPVEALHRLRVPRSVSALMILILTLALLGGAVDLLWKPAQHWFASAPQTLQIIKQRITPIARYMRHLDELRGTADALGEVRPAAGAAHTTTVAVAEPSGPSLLLDVTRNALVGAVTFAIVTLFLLAGGPPMLARMTGAFVDDLHAGHVLKLINQVRAEVGRFYITTTLINLGLGCATGGDAGLGHAESVSVGGGGCGVELHPVPRIRHDAPGDHRRCVRVVQ